MKRVAFHLVLLLSSIAFSAEPLVDGGSLSTRPGRTITQVKLLYFHASWCQSCKRLDAGRVIERLQEREPGLTVERVDVDTQVPLLERYGVSVTPTLLLVDADGFPLGKAPLDLDRPDATLERLHKLVKKMVRP